MYNKLSKLNTIYSCSYDGYSIKLKNNLLEINYYLITTETGTKLTLTSLVNLYIRTFKLSKFLSLVHSLNVTEKYFPFFFNAIQFICSYTFRIVIKCASW